MPTSLDHARVWLAQGRADLAEPALRRALSEDPDDALAHGLLGLCLVKLERMPDAVEQAQEAIRCAPDQPIGHYVLAVASLQRGDVARARRAIDEALRIEPADADAWTVLASLELRERRWRAALAAADRALRLDAEHLGGANVRAIALQQLGRGGEADSQIASALGQDPEDATTHVNAGWRCLTQGRPDDASRHFLEALRIEPGHDLARRGVLEALKARNRFYRAMLSWFLWLGRQSKRTVWIVVVAIFLVPKLLRGLAKTNPTLEPLLTPVIFLVILFVYMTWILDPLFEASLLLHPLGRHALAPDERRRAIGVTACLAAGLLAGLLALVWLPVLGSVALVALLFVIPLSACLSVEGVRRKRIAGWALAAIAVFGVLSVTGTFLVAGTGNENWLILTGSSALLFLAGVALTSWVSLGWGLAPRAD